MTNHDNADQNLCTIFVVGEEYTRNDIHELVGGSKQAYLPNKNGRVVAACLTKNYNPQAPRVILCGRGPQIERASAILSQQSLPLPVFLKLGTNRWEYQGDFKVVKSLSSGPEFERHIAGSGRRVIDISRVILLAPVVP